MFVITIVLFFPQRRKIMRLYNVPALQSQTQKSVFFLFAWRFAKTLTTNKKAHGNNRRRFSFLAWLI